MHECPDCGQACDCDGEDTWFDEVEECDCDCWRDDEGYVEDDYEEVMPNVSEQGNARLSSNAVTGEGS